MNDTAPPRSTSDGATSNPFANWQLAGVLGLFIVLALLFFRSFPQVDIAVSALFHDATLCAGAQPDSRCVAFPLPRIGWVAVVREVLHVIPVAVAVLLLGFVILRRMRGVAFSERFNRSALAAILALILSAGLIVNVILKDHWGRPRPFMTTLFGGDLPFIPAGDISSFCERNCSFVSGEAAGSFWLIGAAALAPPAWRVPAMVAATVLALAASGLRVAFGAHFLSDVTIGASISLLVLCLCALWAARAAAATATIPRH